MSTAVLELNDYAVGLYNQHGMLASSPGWVLAPEKQIKGRQPEFGQLAQEQSRLHPGSSNNEFWHRLGMTPLTRPLANFRHHADIAYAHLMQLAQTSGFEGDVLVAVPASFSREQLAVLSGILQHSPFKALAIMDSALLTAATRLPEREQLCYVDLQLHQLSLTRLLNSDGHVRRDAFAVVPGAGWTGFSNTIVQVATDAFISQSRFNPQHRALWEQQLYNELPDWLQAFQSGQQEILVQIKTDQNTVQARVSRSDVLEALQSAFRKISQHLAQIADDDGIPVLLSERAATIPGLQASLMASHKTVLVTPGLQNSEVATQLARFCQQVLQASDTSSGVPYVTSVSRAARSTDAQTASVHDSRQPAGLIPTHILYKAQAWPLPLNAGLDAQQELVLMLQHQTLNDAQALFRIESDGLQAQLLAASADVLLKGQSITGKAEVSAGDVISVRGLSADIHCIRVHS